MQENRSKKRTKEVFYKGTMILTVSTIIVKIVGIFYQLYIGEVIGGARNAYFSAAYDTFTLILSVATAGLPVALSKMIAERVALQRFREAKQVRRVATQMFLALGIVSSLLMFVLSGPISQVVKLPEAKLSIMVIAPAIFLLGLTSAYRGYYNGLHNMIPTGVSQAIEAIAKLFFSISIAGYVKNLLLNEYLTKGTVMGKIPEFLASSLTESEKTDAVMSAIYPYTSAAALFGITLSVVSGLLFLMVYARFKKDQIDVNAGDTRVLRRKHIFRELLRIAIPVAAASIVASLASYIDTLTIVPRLTVAIEKDSVSMLARYSAYISESFPVDEIPKILLHIYSMMVMPIFTLVPTFTTAFSTTSLPLVSEAWVKKDHEAMKTQVNDVLKLTSWIAMPSTFVFVLMSEPIMNFAFGFGTRAAYTKLAALILSFTAVGLLFVALASPVNAILQGIGRMRFTLYTIGIGTVFKFIFNFLVLGNPNSGAMWVPVGTIICYMVITVGGLMGIIQFAKVHIDVKHVFVKPMLAGLICGLSAFFSYLFLSSILSGRVALLISFVIAITFYVVSLILMRGITKDDILIIPGSGKVLKMLDKKRKIG